MQNVVLIALVLVIVIFAVYQYNPSLFRFMRRDGFADMMDKKKGPMEQSMASAHGDQGAAHGTFPGAAQAAITNSNPNNNPVSNGDPQSEQAYGNGLKTQPEKKKEGFADLSSFEGPANFGAAEAPAGCYPRDQLTPAELLPKDMNSIWAEQNPMGPGSLKGKNFLSAGALIGVNTVGQSLRNANLQIRSEPPNPQVPVSIFLQSTIGPDISHRTLEIN
jgi:hypothetical protein